MYRIFKYYIILNTIEHFVSFVSFAFNACFASAVPAKRITGKTKRKTTRCSQTYSHPNQATGIQKAVKTYNKQVTLSDWYERTCGKQAYSFILNARQEKEGGVPVSSLWAKFSSSKFTNWPSSAGMGPGVYKTQSKPTTK
jgi:hypothetical protein